jgi:hypothetical protein
MGITKRYRGPGFPRGEEHPKTRLTEGDIRSIRERARGGDTYREIALSHGVAIGTIAKIISRENWGHVE